ncbi:hypothetical protein [Nocardia sp. NPDC050175]|uniref:hypothetical protein n=1 Tax=Nocardia sp. NPDC050175 TaxID=3364317 RepID=UPI00378D218D
MDKHPHNQAQNQQQKMLPEMSWLDRAELRLRELVSVHDCPPPDLVRLLGGPVDELQAVLQEALRPAFLKALPGRCEVPWQGCPRHGDLLEFQSLGWGCTVEGCWFGIDDRLTRLRHCRRRPVAVLGEPGPYTLAVCAGHLYSEWELGQCGMPFTVRLIGKQQLAG